MGWSHTDAPALARGLISDIHADLEARVATRDKQLAAYNQLLAELADRLTGGALEEQRRIDPTTPARWQAADWQAFFAQHPLTPVASGATWGSQPVSEDARGQDRAEIERLRTQVQQLQQALQAARSAPTVSAVVKEVPKMTVTAVPTNGFSLTLDEILAELAALAQQLPGPPLTFRSRVADPINSAQAWRRQVQTLYLVARHGFSQAILVDTVLARLEGQELRGGARGKQFERLIKVNLLESSKLSIVRPFDTNLVIWKLTADGRRLAQALFNAEPIETNWERVVRRHQGDEQIGHTLGLLLFEVYARQRGARVQLLPEVAGPTPPDLLIDYDGRRSYVEVELSEKENPAKWRNLAALNDGHIAVCAGNATQRARLVGDCKQLGLSGAATDLQTLVQEFMTHREAAHALPLFCETW